MTSSSRPVDFSPPPFNLCPSVGEPSLLQGMSRSGSFMFRVSYKEWIRCSSPINLFWTCSFEPTFLDELVLPAPRLCTPPFFQKLRSPPKVRYSFSFTPPCGFPCHHPRQVFRESPWTFFLNFPVCMVARVMLSSVLRPPLGQFPEPPSQLDNHSFSSYRLHRSVSL